MPENSLPQIMSLNPSELIRWCKSRKKTLGISNAKLAEMSGIPIGTIDRIMSGNYTEFKYSSVQPIIAILIEINKETPAPDETDQKQADWYYETIEGYKLVVENKNHVIEFLKKDYASLVKEIEFLSEENTRKQETIKSMSEHIKWMERMIDSLNNDK